MSSKKSEPPIATIIATLCVFAFIVGIIIIICRLKAKKQNENEQVRNNVNISQNNHRNMVYVDRWRKN